MNVAQSVPYLSDATLAKLNITPAQVADLIEQLIRDRAHQKVWSAPKAAISLPDGRYAMSTMAIADDPPYLALKSLLLNPRNPSAGEPLMNALIILQDSETGRPAAILDGNWITTMRTAALSVVAARRMARPESRVIAFIGSGLQARAHLLALAEIFPLAEVRILGRGQANIDALHALAAERGMAVHLATDPKDVMAGADLIVSSITREHDRAPFINATHAAPGTFAALVDLAQPWQPNTLNTFDHIIIDDKDQEATMKTPMVAANLVAGDLADLVLDQVNAATTATNRTAFIFRGFALGDFALASLAHRIATASAVA